MCSAGDFWKAITKLHRYGPTSRSDVNSHFLLRKSSSTGASSASLRSAVHRPMEVKLPKTVSNAQSACHNRLAVKTTLSVNRDSIGAESPRRLWRDDRTLPRSVSTSTTRCSAPSVDPIGRRGRRAASTRALPWSRVTKLQRRNFPDRGGWSRTETARGHG